MIKKDHIAQLADEHLQGTKLFVVKISIGKDNLISVIIDGDQGVSIDECVKLSRHIEKNLDRDAEDFELRVSSPGADEPFVDRRQYRKNLGRPVKITLKDSGIVKGILGQVHDDHISVKKEIKKKNKKQKKMVTGESVDIAFNDIAEAKVIIIF